MAFVMFFIWGCLSDFVTGKEETVPLAAVQKARGNGIDKRVTKGQILFLKFPYFLIRHSDILYVCPSLSLPPSLSVSLSQNMCSLLCGKVGLMAKSGYQVFKRLVLYYSSHRRIFNLD